MRRSNPGNQIWSEGRTFHGCLPPPPPGPNSFILMHFLAKSLQNNRLAHPLWELTPPSPGKFWFRYCIWWAFGRNLGIFWPHFVIYFCPHLKMYNLSPNGTVTHVKIWQKDSRLLSLSDRINVCLLQKIKTHSASIVIDLETKHMFDLLLNGFSSIISRDVSNGKYLSISNIKLLYQRVEMAH